MECEHCRARGPLPPAPFAAAAADAAADAAASVPAEETADKRLKRCARCHVGVYCSRACQEAAFKTHKQHVCSLWRGAGDVVHNPWYAPASPPSDRDSLVVDDSEQAAGLLKAARSGDAAALREILAGGDEEAFRRGEAGGPEAAAPRLAPLHTARTGQGATALHLAVTSGRREAVEVLLDAGALVDVQDWRSNTPLNYACSHPGATVEQDSVLDTGDHRRAVVELLLAHGARYCTRDGFTGLRPIEAAERLGYMDVVEAIRQRPRAAREEAVLQNMNKKHPGSPGMERATRQLLDFSWRAETAHWHLNLARHNTQQGMRLHPLLAAPPPSPAALELVFRDIAARHRVFVASIDEAVP